MPEIARALVDYTESHDGTPQLQRRYASGSPNVKVNGSPAVRVTDPTLCGDIALTGSATVRINGLAVHRKGDLALSHDGPPVACETGSEDVSSG